MAVDNTGARDRHQTESVYDNEMQYVDVDYYNYG